VVAAFLLTNEANQLGNINSVGELLVDEGMEIISQSRRHLTEDEAFFLRSRVLTTKE
jgi:formyltetrahydrofolate hydrolase